MKVSIIIPIYNGERFLQRCVESLLRQEIENLEILLVNDHSNDGTHDICRQYCEQFPFVRELYTDGKGVCDARNTGLANATGEIIGFCDCDDFYEDHTLKLVEQAFCQSPETQVVVGGYSLCRETGPVACSRENTFIPAVQDISAAELCSHILLDAAVKGFTWNKFYRKSFLDGVYFDKYTGRAEDLYFNLLLCTSKPNGMVKLLDQSLYYYILQPNSLTQNPLNIFEKNQLGYIVTYSRILHNCSLDPHIALLCRYHMARMGMMYHYSLYRWLDPAKKRELRGAVREHFIAFLRVFLQHEPWLNCKILGNYVLMRLGLRHP